MERKRRAERKLGLGPGLGCGLQLRGLGDLRAPPRGARAPPGEVEPVQFLGDLQEGLAFGLGKEEASVEGPTDTDNEERHVEEVGQSLLEVKGRTVPPETQGGSIFGPRRQGPRTGLKGGLSFSA